MRMAAGWDCYSVAHSPPLDSNEGRADGSHSSSGLAPPVPDSATVSVAAAAVSLVALAPHCPGDSDPHGHPAAAHSPAQPPPRTVPAPSTIPRVGVLVSLLLHRLTRIGVARIIIRRLLRQIAQWRKI